eukprot:scpid64643/ scgid35438/ HIV Tat-specific factor 1 homolog
MAEEAEYQAVGEEHAGATGEASLSGNAPDENPSNDNGQAERSTGFTGPREGYEWDPMRQGYFPKIDDDFMAYYQASYGFVEEDGVVKPAPALPVEEVLAAQAASQPPPPTTEDAENENASHHEKPEKPGSKAAKSAGAPSDATGTAGAAGTTEGEDPSKQAGGKKRKAASDPSWFEMEEAKNNNVYVSGLPVEYSEQEFYDLMSKCGIVKDDDITEEPKIKLYRTKDEQLKGDGLCCYLKHESVALAIQILDGSMVGSGTISVQQAQFERKGEFNPSVRKKKKPKKKNAKSAQEKLLGWNEPKKGPMKRKNEKIVIFHHCFEPKEFEEDALLINEVRDDLKGECEKCGPVHKVIVYDRHPEGVLSVAFKEFEGAEECVKVMNGRWYAGRQLKAELYDGVTSYQIEETDLERVDRLKKWEEFISSETSGQDGASKPEAKPAASDASSADDVPMSSEEPATSAS